MAFTAFLVAFLHTSSVLSDAIMRYGNSADLDEFQPRPCLCSEPIHPPTTCLLVCPLTVAPLTIQIVQSGMTASLMKLQSFTPLPPHPTLLILERILMSI